MSRTTKRSTRLKEIEEFLLARRRPVAIAELAQRFDTNRSTIYRSLIDLETEWDARVGLVQREAPDLERLFEPYFIEPSTWGFSTYVIGFDHHRCDLRTFKVERLLRVRLTTDTYIIPESFDPYESWPARGA